MQYVIDNSDIIVETDSEWDEFAIENDSPHLSQQQVIGTSIWDHVSGESTQQLYRHLFKQVRSHRSHISIPFRCDSPTKKRSLRLVIEPCDNYSLRITSLTESVETREAVALLDESKSKSEEFITICGWCKKIRLSDNRWVEPEYAIDQLNVFEEETPQLSHGICPPCAEQFIREFHIQFGKE